MDRTKLNDDGYIKVYFIQRTGEDSYETETMWCKQIEEYYQLENIPFIAKNIAAGDIISVEYDEEEGVYYFDEFISYSGNSTVRVRIEDADYRKTIMDELIQMGCEAEGFPAGQLLAINIPQALNYKPIRQYLLNGFNNDKWAFQESCLSEEHKAQVE